MASGAAGDCHDLAERGSNRRLETGFEGQPPKGCAVCDTALDQRWREWPVWSRRAFRTTSPLPHRSKRGGNNRQDVFLLDEDRRFYLETLKAKCDEHGVVVMGYCLMTNHVHLVATPKNSDSLARALGQADGRYASWFNKRYRRSGHLWQNRFYSCALGRTHLLTALAYVDLNPIRAGMLASATEYAWSSAKAHAFGPASDTLVDDWSWSELRLAGNWIEVLEL